MGDFVHNVHSKFAPMRREQFDIIHYEGMLATKAAICVLFLFPNLRIRLVLENRR